MHIWGGSRSRSGSASSESQGQLGRDTIRRRSRSPIKKGVLGLGGTLTALTSLSGEMGGGSGEGDERRSGSMDGDGDGGAVIGVLDGGVDVEIETGDVGSGVVITGEEIKGKGKKKSSVYGEDGEYEEGMNDDHRGRGYEIDSSRDTVKRYSVEENGNEEAGRKGFEENRHWNSEELHEDHENGATIENLTTNDRQNDGFSSQENFVKATGKSKIPTHGKRKPKGDSEAGSTNQASAGTRDTVVGSVELSPRLSYEMASEDERKREEKIIFGGIAAIKKLAKISGAGDPFAEVVGADLQSESEKDLKKTIQQQTKENYPKKEIGDTHMDILVSKQVLNEENDDVLLDTTREISQDTIATKERADNYSFASESTMSSSSSSLDNILVVKNGEENMFYLPIIRVKDIMNARKSQRVSSTEEEEDAVAANERMEISSFSLGTVQTGHTSRNTSISLQEKTESATPIAETGDGNDSSVLSELDTLGAEEMDYIPAEKSWVKFMDKDGLGEGNDTPGRYVSLWASKGGEKVGGGGEVLDGMFFFLFPLRALLVHFGYYVCCMMNLISDGINKQRISHHLSSMDHNLQRRIRNANRS
jgi:hypothetical protein